MTSNDNLRDHALLINNDDTILDLSTDELRDMMINLHTAINLITNETISHLSDSTIDDLMHEQLISARLFDLLTADDFNDAFTTNIDIYFLDALNDLILYNNSYNYDTLMTADIFAHNHLNDPRD